MDLTRLKSLLSSSVIEAVLVTSFCILVFYLSFFNLGLYPTTWFDEGANLQVAKNLTLYGKYATHSSGNFETFDVSITTGPTVLVPISFVFRVLGVGLPQARLVMGFYLMATLWAFYLVAQHTFGRRAALAASFLWVALPVGNPIPLGRQVLGEVPALFFFLAGAYFWIQAIDSPSKKRLLLAGFLFGIAVITKSIFVLFIPSLLVSWLAGLFYHQRLKWKHGMLPLLASIVCVSLWTAYQFYQLGWTDFMRHIEATRAFGKLHVSVFHASTMVSNAKFLLKDFFHFYLGIPALIYVSFLGLDRTSTGIKRLFLASFCATWLSWYVFASIGWSRYAMIPFALLTMFIVALFSDVSNSFSLLSGEMRQTARTAAVTLSLTLMIVFPLQSLARQVTFASDRSPQKLAAYIDANISKAALIESWSWEVDFLTIHSNYHYPPLQVHLSTIGFLSFGAPYSPPADLPPKKWIHR